MDKISVPHLLGSKKSAGQSQELNFLFFAGNFCFNETIYKHFGYGKTDSYICQTQGKTSLRGFREQLQYP